MSGTITLRVRGADGCIVPATYRAGSLAEAEAKARAQGYEVMPATPDASAAPMPGSEPEALPAGLFLEPPASRQAGPAAPRIDAMALRGIDARIARPTRIPNGWAPWAWVLPILVVAQVVAVRIIITNRLQAGASPEILNTMLQVSAQLTMALVVLGELLSVAAIARRRAYHGGGLVHGIVGLVLGTPLLGLIVASLLVSPALFPR